MDYTESIKASPEEIPELQDPIRDSIVVTLVGIKNLKSQNTFRLEFDILAQDQSKVKALVDELYSTFYMYLVKHEEN